MSKKLVQAILITFFMGFIFNISSAVTVTKTWQYGRSTQKSWESQGIDEWGGANYWCIGEGTGCGEFDWKAVYFRDDWQFNLTPAHTNTPEYGNSLVQQAAIQQQIQLPVLPMPTLTIEVDSTSSHP